MGVVRQDVVQVGFDIDFDELTRLTDGMDEIQKACGGGVGDDAFDDMIKESKKAAESVEGVKDGLSDIDQGAVGDDAFDDMIKDSKKATESVKETEKQSGKAHEQLKKIASTSFDKTINGLKKLGSAVGKVALEAGKLAAKGLVAGVAGVGALVTKSVMSFADYEQLVGGVETLFKDAAGAVQKNAAKAFETAGMSENTYMDTVTSFSASLINSLGGDTKKAAEFAHTAIVDMSDNANKMGTDLDSLVQTYQSLARGNFAMLDNLKLGYGGTKEELNRLLKDAEKLTGIEYDVSSFADIVAAIHAVQVEMDIAGTTSKEASTTISGSFASLKAAWSNTLTALVLGGGSFDKCIDNLVKSAKTFGKNVMPAIQKSLKGVGMLITELAPVLEKELPVMIDTLLPPLISAATSLVKGLIIALPDIVSTIAKEMPNILSQLWDGIKEAFGDIPAFQKVEGIFGKLNTWLSENAGMAKKLAGGVVGLVASFKLIKKLGGIASLFGGKGDSKIGGDKGSKNGLLGFFGKLAEIKPKNILKGMLNIALVLGGLVILSAALLYLAPKLAGMSDLKSIGTVLGVMTAVGLLGSGMAWASSMIGNIPVAKIAKGLLNITIVIGGLGLLAAGLMAVAPYMSKLSSLKDVGKILLAISAVGLIGAGLSLVSGIVGAVPVALVAKGLANIAIVLVGFGALATVLMWAAPYVMQLSDMSTLFKLLGMISAVGLIGAALTVLSGVVGIIPTGIVATGLANIAVVLGGFTAVAAAFGALSQVDGFTELINNGGEVLTNLCGIIGNMAGTLVGSFGTSLSASLPAIGENLSAFATSLQPMFDMFAGVNMAGLTDFAGAMGAFVAVIAGDALVNAITGGVDYAGLGTNLSTMATSLGGFFDAIMTLPDGGFDQATALFNCLAGIESMPKEGGVVGWFEGEVDYTKIATGIAQLAGAADAFTAFENIPAAGITSATKLFDCLAGIKSLPKNGGFVGWFAGEVDFSEIASGIQSLSSESMLAAFKSLSTVSRRGITNLGTLFDTLAGIKSMPKTGGVVGWFAGEQTATLSSIAGELPGLATNVASFFNNIGDIDDFSPITNLFNALGQIEISSDATKGTGFLGLGDSALATIGTNLSDFATNAAGFFSAVNGLNTDSLSTFFDGLNEAGGLVESLTGLDGTVGTTLSNMVTTVEGKFEAITTAITTSMNSAVIAVTDAVSAMQSAMNFSWSLPHLKVPSINISGGFSLQPPAAPKFSLSWHKDGGIMTQPTLFGMTGDTLHAGGEAGAEAVLPLDLLWDKMESMIHSAPYAGDYSPESGTTTYYNGGNSEYTTISPVFNLTISGSTDDRVLARKVKRYVSQGISDVLESFERKTYVTREA